MRIDYKIALALTATTMAALLLIAAIFSQQSSEERERLNFAHLRVIAVKQAAAIDALLALTARPVSDANIDVDASHKSFRDLPVKHLTAILQPGGGLVAGESSYLLFKNADEAVLALDSAGEVVPSIGSAFVELIAQEQNFARTINHHGQEVLAVLQPLSDPKWMVLSELDAEQGFDPLGAENFALLRAFWVITLFALGVAAYVAWQITVPMVKLARVAEQISQGDFHERGSEQGNDEFSQLAKAVNRMADKLVGANLELEKRIQEKTEDLRKANEALKQLNDGLQRMSHEDKLTGLANRRAFDQRFEHEWRRCELENRPLCLLLMDIDYFKQFNDELGHQAGDECLSRVGRVLKDTIARSTDFVARYGGEEFVAILPGTYSAQGRLVAQRISEAMKLEGIAHPKSQVSEFVTLSGGLGAVTPRPGISAKEFVTQVDAALYAAKAAGRNRFMRSEQA